MKNTILRLIVGVSTFSLTPLFLVADTTKLAQASEPFVPEQSEESHRIKSSAASLLLPLTPQGLDITPSPAELEHVANHIHGQMQAAQAAADAAAAAAVLDWAELPILRDFLGDDGDVDFGMNLPVSVQIGDVVGETGVVLGADFSVE